MLHAWKNFTSQHDDEPQVPLSLLHRCVSLFLSGTALNMYCFDNVEHNMLKNRLSQLEEEFAAEAEEKDFLNTITKVLRVLDIYNQRCEKQTNSAGAESRHTIRFLIDLLLKKELGAEVQQALLESGRQFEKARTAEEVLSIRKKLEQQLRQQDETGRFGIQAGGSGQNDRYSNLLTESPTGLRGRDVAIDRIKKIIAERNLCYGVTIRLDCLTAVQTRYGTDAAQDLLNAIAHFIIQALHGTDALFHWEESCLFAVLDRALSPDSMTHEVHRLSQIKRELRIDVDGRAVIFAVPTSTDLFPISSSSDLQTMIEKIDRFARGGY